MTKNTSFVNIYHTGDIMSNTYEKRKKDSLLYKIKELFANKKYSMLVKEATKYLNEYYPHPKVVFMRAKSYKELGFFDEAISDLKYLIEKENNTYAILELYYTYYYLNKYKEAIDLLPFLYNSDVVNKYSIALSELVMKKQLGIKMNFNSKARCDYIASQIINYDINKALEHINEHKESSINSSNFNAQLNLEYLFELIRNNLINSTKINKDEILEVHYFCIPNIGLVEENVCNYLKVVVIPNTNNIISMYPTINYEGKEPTIITYDYSKLFNKDKEKVKSISMIDRFNKKYGYNM